MKEDIFDSPASRSTNLIGTSVMTRAVLARPVGHLDLEAVPLGADPSRSIRRRMLGRVARGSPPSSRPRRDRARPTRRGCRRARAGGGARPSWGWSHPPRSASRSTTSKPSLERRHQRRQRGGVVREVGVDLDAGVVAALEAPGEAGPVRAAEPRLGGPLEHVDVGQLGRDASSRGRPCRRGSRRRPPARRRRAGTRESGAASARCSPTRCRSG